MHRHANKAVPVGFTGEIGPKQMWERACPRCAARAALDLKGDKSLQPYPSQQQPNPEISPPTNIEIDFSYNRLRNFRRRSMM